MEPQVQYCTTSDGVSIAYYVRGTGPALVATIGSWESIRFDSDEVLGREYYDELARYFRLVRYDRRGVGLSDIAREDFSLDADVRDLEAVVAATGLESFALLGQFHMGPVAIKYAAAHPEQVSRLVLYGTYARGADLTGEDVQRSLTAMLRSHWGIASRTITDMVSPGVPGDTLDRIAAHTRASVTGEMAAALLEMSYACDVTAELARITAPTVIIHRDHDRAVAFRLGRALASHIAGARLVSLEGQVHWPWVGDVHSVTNAIVEFLSPERGANTAASSATASQASGTAVILFTDIVSSTELTERMGDVAFRDASRALDAGLRAAIREAGGAAIDGKLLGDGVLATFPSAAQAIDGARRCLTLSAASELGLHIGLHAGDVIREDNNVYGGAVNIAARICGLSAPGEILVSDVVRGMARSSAGVEFEDRGEQEMKGVGEPVRVYAVRGSA